MKQILESIAAYSGWLLSLIPILCLVVYLAIQSRWDSYSRKENYEEPKVLNELREKNILTQQEFEAKKKELLAAGPGGGSRISGRMEKESNQALEPPPQLARAVQQHGS